MATSGREVLKRKSNQELASMPVMICMGVSDDDVEIKAFSYGANDFIRKPLAHKSSNTG